MAVLVHSRAVLARAVLTMAALSRAVLAGAVTAMAALTKRDGAVCAESAG